MLIRNYIGVDISKHWLDFAVFHRSQYEPVLVLKCLNTTKDLISLKKTLDNNSIKLNASSIVVCEYTGLYGKLLLNFLKKQKCLVCVEVPQRIKKSLGIQRGKNDLLDAKRIGLYALKNADNLCLWKPPRKIVVTLKDLMTNRERLKDSINRIKVPLNELNKFYTIRAISHLKKLNKKALEGLKLSLEEIVSEIDKICSNDSKISHQLELLMSVPGLGKITSLFLICYTREFSLCQSGKQLACYIGVAPFEHQSGSSVQGKTRVSHIANKRMKSLLHLSAMSQVRAKGELAKYFERKVLEGKNKNLVLNAISNKIILRAFAVIKRDSPYLKLPN